MAESASVELPADWKRFSISPWQDVAEPAPRHAASPPRARFWRILNEFLLDYNRY